MATVVITEENAKIAEALLASKAAGAWVDVEKATGLTQQTMRNFSEHPERNFHKTTKAALKRYFKIKP